MTRADRSEPDRQAAQLARCFTVALAFATGCELVGGITGEREVTRFANGEAGSGGGADGSLGGTSGAAANGGSDAASDGTGGTNCGPGENCVGGSGGGSGGTGAKEGGSGGGTGGTGSKEGGSGGGTGGTVGDELCHAVDTTCQAGNECCTGRCAAGQCATCSADQECTEVLSPGESGVLVPVCNNSYCAAVLASNETDALGIAVSATHVFWTRHVDQADAGASLGTVRTILLGPNSYVIPGKNTVAKAERPLGVCIADGYVYWAASGSKQIWRASAPPGVPFPFTPEKVADTLGEPQFVAASATHVYWTNDTGHVEAKTLGGPDGGATGVVNQTTGAGYGIATLGTPSDETVCSTAGDSTQCWHFDGTGWTKNWVITAGDSKDIVMDPSLAYWVRLSSVYKADLVAGGQAGAGGVATSIVGLTTDGARLYLKENAGRISRLVAGGANDTISWGAPGPGKIAVDSKFVYWTDTAVGKVMRARK